jgi:hypothetical protein
MRDELFDYVSGLDLGGFTLSNELPWTESAIPLYQKNPRRIYIDVDQYTTEPLLLTLNGLVIGSEISTVRVYFSCDAKQVPSNYSILVSDLRAGKDITTISGVNRRECDVNTEFVNDLLITELEYRFTKLI